MMPLHDELMERQRTLEALLRQRRSNGASSTEEEIDESQRAAEGLTRQLQQALAEITDMGIIVRDVARGLVDFPSLQDGREVYLCWLRGEESIDFWHEINRGFDNRQPL